MSKFAEELSDSDEMPCVSEHLEQAATNFILHGYARGENCTSLADLRTKKFLGGSAVVQSLPPTADSFLQHIKRASLSTIVMKSARIPVILTIRYDCYG